MLPRKFRFIIKRHCTLWPQRENHLFHLWNNISSFIYHHCITNSNILTSNLICIVQTCVLYRCTCQLHCIKHRHGCCRPRATQRQNNIPHHCSCLLSLVFIGDCRTWLLANNAQHFINLPLIYFNNQPIRVKRQSAALI